MELAAEPTSEAEALAEKYGASGSDVDAELAAMKAEAQESCFFHNHIRHKQCRIFMGR